MSPLTDSFIVSHILPRNRHQLNQTSHVSSVSEYTVSSLATLTSVKRPLPSSMVLWKYLLGSKHYTNWPIFNNLSSRPHNYTLHHHGVHIKEVPETQLEPTETKPLPGLAFPDPDNIDQGDRIFIWFIGEQSEVIGAMQNISQ